MKFKRCIKFTLITLLLGGVVFGYLYPVDSPPEEIIYPVTQGNIRKTVSAGGVLQPVEQVDIGAQVSGQIKSIPVKEGQRVKKGDLLAVIDPQLAETELKLAKAELEIAQANLDTKTAILKQHQADLQRQRSLIKKGATTQQLVDEAQMRFDVVKAEIRSAQSQLEAAIIRVDKAQTQLGYTEIRSPMNAVVISVIAKAGQTLATLQQVPVLMKLANIDIMQINAKISEADVVNIRQGATVMFNLLGEPYQQFSAQLDDVKLAPTYLSDQLDGSAAANNAVYYYATFKVPNPQHKLRIAMSAAVTILLEQRENVLTIPLSALGKMVGQDEYQVRVLDAENEIVQKTVKIGLKDDANAEVLTGLSLDDQVLLSAGADNLNNDDIYSIL